MRLIAAILSVLLLSQAAYGAILFEDNFNSQADWKNTCRTCGKTYSGYSGAGAEDGIPDGWSYWRADEHWNPDDAAVPTPNSKPVMRITDEVDAQGSGKAFIFTNESENNSPEDSGGWSSDGELSVALPQDYDELFFQFRVKFAPNFARYYTSANPAMIKFFRVYHWDRNGSPYAYFSNGTAAPIALPKAVQNEFGAAFGNDAMRCDPQATNYSCDQTYVDAKAKFVSKSCGTVSYPTNAPPYTDTSAVGLFDSEWHSVQIRVKLNSAPGVNDGLYTIWQDGCLVKDLTNVQWIGTGGDINAGWNFVSIGGNAFNNWLGITNDVYQDGAEQWYAIDDVVVSTTMISDDYEIGVGAPDTTAPTVTTFTLPVTYSSTTVPVSAFAATDNTGVTGYAITTSASTPTSWSGTPPTTVTAVEGANTFYAWTKDAAGNVSNPLTATVTVTLPATGKKTISGKFKAKAR